MAQSKFLIACQDEEEFAFLGRVRNHFRQGKAWEEMEHRYVLTEDDTLLHSVALPETVILTSEAVLADMEHINGHDHSEEAEASQEVEASQEAEPAPRQVRSYQRRKPVLSAQSRKVLQSLKTLKRNPVRDRFLQVMIEEGGTADTSTLHSRGLGKNDLLGVMTHFGRALRKGFSEEKLGHRPIRELVEMKRGYISLTEHGREAAIRYLQS